MQPRARQCPRFAWPGRQRAHEPPIVSRPPTLTSPSTSCRGSARTTTGTGSPTRESRIANQPLCLTGPISSQDVALSTEVPADLRALTSIVHRAGGDHADGQTESMSLHATPGVASQLAHYVSMRRVAGGRFRRSMFTRRVRPAKLSNCLEFSFGPPC
jgi:hypothetical protein